jgi:hypothetical protein
MIGEWVAKALVKISGINVVHSIPGRLRVHFTGGAKAREFMQKQDEIPEKVFLYKLRGIESFDFNPLTSKALIIYDPDMLGEKEILSWLKRLQELIIQSVMKGDRKIDQESIDRIASQLTQEGYAMEKFEQRTSA